MPPVPLHPAALAPEPVSQTEARRARVLEVMVAGGYLDAGAVDELAQEFGVSPATIRRDRYAVRGAYAKHLDQDRQGERADLVARVREAAERAGTWQLLKLESDLLPPAPPAADGSEDYFTTEEEALRYLASFPPDLLRRALDLQTEGS